MSIYRISAYVILQMFDVSVYMPLYTIRGGARAGEKLVLKDVKVEAKGALELFGKLVRHGKDGGHYLDSLEIHRIEEGERIDGRAREVSGDVVFGTMAFDFSMLKAILSQSGQQAQGHPPEIKIKSIEIKIPLAIQIFLHVPIVLVAVIVFYLFLSFGIDDGEGLSDKEIEKIPLCLYSEQHINKGCTICLEDFDDGEYVRSLGCGHVFHKECVDMWLRRNFVCPICRNKMAAESEQACEARSIHVL